MRVLVTGAAGFVGSHVVRDLIRQGDEVAVIVRETTDLWRLKGLPLRNYTGELTDPRTVQDFRPEACVHLAWYAEPGKYLDSPRNDESARESLALLHLLAKYDCARAVMIGTCAEYSPLPRPLKESHPTAPLTAYAWAKNRLRQDAERFAGRSGIEFAWARLFYLFGPMEDERRLVPALIRRLAAGEEFPASRGEQIRDYLHVADVAAGLSTITHSRETGVFNVCSSERVPIRELMETVADEVGSRDLIRFGALPPREWDPACLVGDNTRLRSLGWSPRYGLREGIHETVQHVLCSPLMA